MLDAGQGSRESNVVSLAGAVPGRRRVDRPLLVLIDVLQEYIEHGRPLCLDSIEESLYRCSRVLTHARQRRWSIAHVRWRQEHVLFNEHQGFSDFIVGFEARGNEVVLDKPEASAYSNADFASMMNARRGRGVFVAGYQGPTCLATLIDAHSRGHRLTFIADASSSPRIEGADETTAHEYLVNFARQYGDVAYHSEVISGTGVARMPETSVV